MPGRKKIPTKQKPNQGIPKPVPARTFQAARAVSGRSSGTFLHGNKNSKQNHVLDHKRNVKIMAALERAESCKELLCPYIVAQLLETM